MPVPGSAAARAADAIPPAGAAAAPFQWRVGVDVAGEAFVELTIDGQTVDWAANKSLEISIFNFKFPRARNYEMIGLVLGCIEAKFCK